MQKDELMFKQNTSTDEHKIVVDKVDKRILINK